MSIRIKPWWRRFKRNGYRLDRCESCGHRFRWKRDARFASGNRDGKVWHGPCMAARNWQQRAEERLTMLGTVLDLTGWTPRDIKGAIDLRHDDHDERVTASNQAFRVFRDLAKATPSDTERGSDEDPAR